MASSRVLVVRERSVRLPPAGFIFFNAKENEPKEGTPASAPSGPAGLQVRSGLRGFVDGTSCTDDELAHVLCATLRA